MLRCYSLLVAVGACAAAFASASALSQAGPVESGTVFVVPGSAPNTAEVRVVTRSGNVDADLIVLTHAERVIVNDRSGDHLNAGAGCENIEGAGYWHRVVCPFEKGAPTKLQSVRISLGGGDDAVSMKGADADIRVDGGPGDDFIGGYAFSPDPVLVGLDGLDDYPHPRGRASGGPGNDRITVADEHDSASGGPGNDRLILVGRNGTLDGGRGHDRLHATDARGRAVLLGGGDNDTIYGSRGGDRVVGGRGHDVVFSGHGADQVYIRDGASDSVNCGGGADTVTADRKTLHESILACEKVKRPTGNLG